MGVKSVKEITKGSSLSNET